MKKPKTKAQLDRATDQRLQKTYNRDLKWYDSQLKEQGGGCAVCGKPPGTRRLHVDHDHSWKKVKIETVKSPDTGKWIATAKYLGKDYTSCGLKKSLAARDVKRQLLRDSVRGLLCYAHNAGLQKFSDRPDLLRAAADYLEAHQNPDSGLWTYCDGCDGTGLMEGWNRRDGFSCPKCKGEAMVKEAK